MLVQQFSNCCKPKPQLPSGFFLKKKSPCTALGGAHELENCSRPWGQPSPAIRVCRPASRQSPMSRTEAEAIGARKLKNDQIGLRGFPPPENFRRSPDLHVLLDKERQVGDDLLRPSRNLLRPIECQNTSFDFHFNRVKKCDRIRTGLVDRNGLHAISLTIDYRMLSCGLRGVMEPGNTIL